MLGKSPQVGPYFKTESLIFQEVRLIVAEALRLFSQDRTGLADYALESGGQKRPICFIDALRFVYTCVFCCGCFFIINKTVSDVFYKTGTCIQALFLGLYLAWHVCTRPAGGSILSTRCSETYETKAALLSLFGIPLWYFSQSPRAVIQVTHLLNQHISILAVRNKVFLLIRTTLPPCC